MTVRLVAVATDVGAWRIVEPVLRELRRRGASFQAMLAEPCASIARQDGVEHIVLDAPAVSDMAEVVLSSEPSVLILGTSVRAVVERELTRRARGRVPTLAVLDAMLFAERRFGTDFEELADLVTCPDEATAERLRRAGASAGRLAVTGNPTLEEIGLWAQANLSSLPWGPFIPTAPQPSLRHGEGEDGCLLPLSVPVGAQFIAPSGGEVTSVDILFVSSPVARMRVHDAVFEIDEHEALADLLAALVALRHLAPGGFRVRVRLHPVQRSEGLPLPPPGLTLIPDDHPDRLASCATAHIVVGLSSTLLGEARFLPRAAIAYLPGEFWDREHVFAPEYGVQRARTAAELRALLVEALTQPPAPAPLAGHLGAVARIADLALALASR
jgi:hypothetical protein